MLLILTLLYLLVLAWSFWQRRSYLPDILAIGALAVFTLAFFWRLVSGDAFSPADGGDLGSFLYPTYRFIQHSLQMGVWPLWNPHIYSGTPFTAEVQSGILYPPHLLRFLVGTTLRYQDMQALSMLHIWWAGTTTYLLARGLRLYRLPALLAATAFMFSDLFLIHFGNLNLIAVASWIPLTLLGIHRSLKNNSLRAALAAGLALGIGSLAGHIQMTLFGLMAMGLWVGMWLLLERKHWRTLWPRALRSVLVPGAVTLGLIMPLLLPGLELARLSERSAWQYVQSVGFSLSPAQLIGLLIPGFFGRGAALHWGMWPRVEVGYVGVITLVLALVALFVRRERITWQMLGLALLSLAFSMGIYSIVHGWLTWLLPGLEQLRAPARFIFLFDLAVALLAAQGLQTLLTAWNDASRKDFDVVWRGLRSLLLIALAVGAPVIYAVLLLTQSADPTLHLRASISTIAVVDFLLLYSLSLLLLWARRRQWLGRDLFGILVLALLLIDLASLGAYEDLGDKDPTANFQHPAIVEFLQTDPDLFRIDARTDIEQLWQPDTALVYGLDDIWGVVNPLTLTYYRDYLEATGGRSSDLYALTNVKYVIARKDVVLDWNFWDLAFEGDPDLNVYRFRRFSPRVLLVGQTRPVPSLGAAQDSIRQSQFQALDEAIIEGGEALSGPKGEAYVLAWEMNKVRVKTTSAAAGALIIAQTWYPGWQAQVDGGAWQPVLRADGAWQAVMVPAGEHTVVLRFQPTPFFLGLALAALTLITVLVARWRLSSSIR